MKSVKAELVQMGDINEWQRIYITPIDEYNDLLRTKPRD